MKPWNTKEWKTKRAKLIKGKTCFWCGSTKKLSIHHPQKQNSLTKEEYMSMKNTIILCVRCHCAIHKGLKLCRCKNHYHYPKKEMCSFCLKIKCFKEKTKIRELGTNNFYQYVKHSICEKLYLVKVDKKDGSIPFDSELCEYCKKNPCNLKKDFLKDLELKIEK